MYIHMYVHMYIHMYIQCISCVPMCTCTLFSMKTSCNTPTFSGCWKCLSKPGLPKLWRRRRRRWRRRRVKELSFEIKKEEETRGKEGGRERGREGVYENRQYHTQLAQV